MGSCKLQGHRHRERQEDDGEVILLTTHLIGEHHKLVLPYFFKY